MFFAGFGVGAAVALWLAPKSGAALRDEISGRVAGKVADGQRAVRDAVEDTVGGVRTAFQKRAAVVDHTVKEGIAAFKEAQDVFMKT